MAATTVSLKPPQMATRREYSRDERRQKQETWPSLLDRRRGPIERRGRLKSAIHLNNPQTLEYKPLLIVEKNAPYAKAMKNTFVHTSRPLLRSESKIWHWQHSDIKAVCSKGEIISATHKHYFQKMIVNLDADFSYRMAFVQKVKEKWPKCKLIATTKSTNATKLSIAKDNGLKYILTEPFEFSQVKQVLLSE